MPVTTGFSYTLSLINGKYKMTILYTLMEFGVVQFNEIKRYIENISYMETLARDLIKISSQKEVGKYGVCPVSQTCDIVRIVYKKL